MVFFKINKIFTFAILCVILLSCSNNAEQQKDTIDLSGKWKIIEAVDEAYDPAFDDSKYPEIIIPGTWTHLLLKNKNMTSTVLLRKSIFIDESKKKDLHWLVLGRIGIADQLYFNGVRIGATGTIPQNLNSLEYKFSWQNPRLYHIPESIIKYGEDNFIAIKIYSHVFSGIMGKAAITSFENNYFSTVFHVFGPLVLTIVSLSLNFIFFIGLVAMFIAQSEKKEYLFFAIICR